MWRWVAIAAMAMAAGSAGAAPPPPSGAVVYGVLLKSPQGPTWRALHRVFPKETDAMFDHLAVQALKGRQTAPLFADLYRQAQALVASQLHYAPQADDAHLHAYVQAEAEHMQALKEESVQACLRAVEPPIQIVVGTTPRAIKSSQDMAVAQLDAIQAGRDHPVVRQPVSAEDMNALMQAAVALGADAGAVRSELDGGRNAVSPALRCDSLVKLLRAAAAPPPGMSGRVISRMMNAGASIYVAHGITGETVLLSLEGVAGMGPSMERFRQAYPAESQALGEAMAKAVTAGDVDMAALFERQLYDLVRKTHALSVASDASMVALAKAHVATMQAMIDEDPAACGRMLVGVAAKESAMMGQPNNATVKLNAAILDVIVAAREAPTTRAPVTAEDGVLVRSAMIRRGLSAPEADAVIEGKLAQLPEAGRCGPRLALWQAAADAPPEVAGRVVAALVLPVVQP